MAGDDDDAKEVVGKLIRAVGFEPVDLGGLAASGLLDAPRRDSAVYGEAYTPEDARDIARLAAQPARAAELALSCRL